MPQHRVTSVTVVLDDGSTHTMTGLGSATVVRTRSSDLKTPVGRVEITMPMEAEWGPGGFIRLPTCTIGTPRAPEPEHADEV